MKNEARTPYVLGHGSDEHRRLMLQSRFVGDLTETVFMRAGLAPGMSVLDIGCGAGDVSFLAAAFVGPTGKVLGIDQSPDSVALASERAKSAGLTNVRFEVGVLENLQQAGPFDVLVDYGTLDDLSASDRDRYVRNVVPLARPGARFLLWCFQWPPRRLDRWLGFMPVAPGEVARRFGNEFTIEQLGGTERPAMRRFIPGYAAYLMTRHAHKEDQDS